MRLSNVIAMAITLACALTVSAQTNESLNSALTQPNTVILDKLGKYAGQLSVTMLPFRGG